jgi:hypothetical protein
VIEKQIVEMLKQAQDGATKHLPVAMDTLYQAIFYSCLFRLIVSFVILVAFALLVRWAYPKWRNAFEDCEDDDELVLGIGIVSCILLVIIAGPCLIEILSASNWIGLFNQKAYIALEILEKIKQ